MEQNNVTRNGTLKSTMNPWKMETMTNSCPEQRVIMGRAVSMVVASFPKKFTNRGAQSKAMISRMMFESNAMVPNSAPLYSVMNILESE